MIILFVFLLVVSIVLVKMRVADFLSRFVIYSFIAYWYSAFALSLINPYGYYPVSSESYLLLLIGVSSFIIGMLIPKRKNSGNKANSTIGNVISKHYINNTVDSIISNKFVLFVYIGMVLYCIPFVGIAISSAAFEGGVAMDDKIEVIFQGSAFNSLMYQYIMYPLVHIDLCLMAYSVYRKKGNWVSIVIFAVFFLEFALIAGGRTFFVITGVYFIIVYVCITPKQTIRKINLKKIVAFAGIVVIALYGISLMTSYREEGELKISDSSSSESSFSQSSQKFISYTISPISMFDRAFDWGLYDKYQYKYGRATFAGVDVLFNGIMRRLGIPYKSTKEIVDDVQETYMQIGPSQYSNYAYTGMFYHYIDFGILGLVVIPLFFGVCYRRIILKYNNRQTFSGILLIGVLYFMMLHSCFTCYFIKTWIVPYIVILMFFNQRHKRLLSTKNA